MPILLPSKTAANTQADAVNALATIEAARCSECGSPGPIWANPSFSDKLCPPCLAAYIAWEEAEISQARAGLLLLTACRRRYAA